MAQHFLLSTAARACAFAGEGRPHVGRRSPRRLPQYPLGPTDGAPVCPHCGCLGVYRLRDAPCSSARLVTSIHVTSGTIFASRKLPLRDYLLAIAIFVNGAKGHSALQLSRDLDCQYKTAFVLAHKIREALAAEKADETVSGDGRGRRRLFRRLCEARELQREPPRSSPCVNQNGKRRVVVIARERDGKTLPFVFKSEAASLETLARASQPGSTVHADEATHWDALHSRYLTKRINHEEAYSDGEACTNQAESFFSRLRRAEIGTHHHIAGPYLAAYAAEMAWREDNRRVSNGEQYLMAANAALAHPVVAQWKGYWQRGVCA